MNKLGLCMTVHYLLLAKETLFFSNPSSHISVDITVFHNGYHGDLNETFFVGEVDDGAKRLVQTTYECLMQAIDAGKKNSFCFILVWWFQNKPQNIQLDLCVWQCNILLCLWLMASRGQGCTVALMRFVVSCSYSEAWCTLSGAWEHHSETCAG